MAQGASLERYEYAQRNGLAERVALSQNVPKMPFKNEKLAATFGKSVAEMDAMPVNSAALAVIYDALCESKSSMIPSKVIDERRQRFVTADGRIDEGAISGGLVKSRVAVTTGFILLGKGQLYGLVFVGRVILDYTGLWETAKGALGPYFEPLYWTLSLAVAAYAVAQSIEVANRTGDYKTYSKEEAEELELLLKNDPSKATTVLGNLGQK
jgi:hypothetical protein